MFGLGNFKGFSIRIICFANNLETGITIENK